MQCWKLLAKYQGDARRLVLGSSFLFSRKRFIRRKDSQVFPREVCKEGQYEFVFCKGHTFDNSEHGIAGSTWDLLH